jgi:hypothetical protein
MNNDNDTQYQHKQKLLQHNEESLGLRCWWSTCTCNPGTRRRRSAPRRPSAAAWCRTPCPRGRTAGTSRPPATRGVGRRVARGAAQGPARPRGRARRKHEPTRRGLPPAALTVARTRPVSRSSASSLTRGSRLYCRRYSCGAARRGTPSTQSGEGGHTQGRRRGGCARGLFAGRRPPAHRARRGAASLRSQPNARQRAKPQRAPPCWCATRCRCSTALRGRAPTTTDKGRPHASRKGPLVHARTHARTHAAAQPQGTARQARRAPVRPPCHRGRAPARLFW